jgi:hypothetical protein
MAATILHTTDWARYLDRPDRETTDLDGVSFVDMNRGIAVRWRPDTPCA